MIHFYDKHRRLVMSISNFTLQQKKVVMMSFSVNISYDSFLHSAVIEDYPYLFEQFRNELEELYVCQRTKVSFALTERQLCLDFEYREYGQIFCALHVDHYDLADEMYHSSLHIEFGLDQSFLPELIREFDVLIEQ